MSTWTLYLSTSSLATTLFYGSVLGLAIWLLAMFRLYFYYWGKQPTGLLVKQLNWGLNKEMSTVLSGIIQKQSFLRLMVCLVIPKPEQTKLLNYWRDGPRGSVRKMPQNRTECSVISLQQKGQRVDCLSGQILLGSLDWRSLFQHEVKFHAVNEHFTATTFQMLGGMPPPGPVKIDLENIPCWFHIS